MGLRFAIIGSRGYPSTYGGFETLVRRLAPYMLEQGHSVTVYCRDGRRRAETIDGVECVRTRGVNSTSLSTLSYGLTAALDARRRKFDAALVLNVANGYFLPILKSSGTPTLINVDGLEWDRDKWSRLGKATFRTGAKLTAKYATELVADSREIGRVWQERFERSSTFIPYGADVVENLGCDRVKALGLQPGRYVLMVARIVPENNIDLFLDAVPLLDPSMDVVVVGSGAEGGLTDRLQRLQSSQQRFHWMGHVHDQDLLAQLWFNAGAYFHGHSVGGTNPGLLQALGYGAPTIAIDTPFNAEVLDGPQQIVAAKAAVVAARLSSLLNCRQEGQQLAARGRSIIGERYRWEDVLRNYVDALQGLAT